MATIEDVRARLEAVDQAHLFTFAESLDDKARQTLVEQIAGLPIEDLPRFVETYVKQRPDFSPPADIAPAPYFPASGEGWNPGDARAAGEALIAAGKVACFTVAGGQGSRLGFDGPKGCYPTGAVSNKTLFELFAEQIRAAGRKYKAAIPWLIMTSPLNHDATVKFFADNAYFGLVEQDVTFFKQGVMPSFDATTGKVLLAEQGTVATNPDGHGGSIRALHESGSLDMLAKRGVEQISYFQVDNPNVKILDPVFIGLHAAGQGSSGEVSSKMLPKVSAGEKVGVFCTSAGRTRVIEYSDLPNELATQTDDSGALRFIAGSIAIHVFSVAFLKAVATDPSMELPFHRADKKVAHVNIESGEPVAPTEPNAVKLERFVFDAIPLAQHSIVYETDRVEEFAPVKNKEGVDSIVSSKQLQTERAARWLEAAGVTVPRKDDGTPNCVLEISPLTALDPEDLKGSDKIPASIDPGASLAL